MKLFLCCLLVGSSCALAQETREKEDIEAAMIFAASKFVTWPQPITGSFDMCLTGEGKLSQALQKYAGKRLKGVEIKIRPLRDHEAASGCRIVVMPHEKAPTEQQRLESVKDQPIMTVGETSGFTDAGGTLGFLLVDGKVRFEINLDAAKKAGLSMGSQMTGLAVSVKGTK